MIASISRLGTVVSLALALWLAGAAGPALAQGQAALVRVDAVRDEPLSQTVPVLGRLVARQAGVVAARINGPVDRFLVEIGDRIEIGQVIAVLDGEALKSRRDVAASELAVARAEHATHKAELELVRLQLKRMEGLKTSAAFNQARFEDARQQVAISKAELKETETGVLSAQAELRLTEINLYNIEIRALYDGVVTQRLTEAGSYVQVGEPVVRMIADRSLEIEADVPYQRLTGLSLGTTLEATLDDGSNHSAILRAIIPVENPLTRTRAVRFVPRFNAIGRPLAADQSITVHIPVGAARSVLTVHKDAIIKRGPKSLVFVAVDGSVEQREIQVGEAVGSRYEILSGLEKGDVVVVRGNERLRQGDKVRINEAS